MRRWISDKGEAEGGPDWASLFFALDLLDAFRDLGVEPVRLELSGCSGCPIPLEEVSEFRGQPAQSHLSERELLRSELVEHWVRSWWCHAHGCERTNVMEP